MINLPLLICALRALQIWVSPQGKDSNPGTSQLPLKTLAAAQALLRLKTRSQNITVIVRSGVYYLQNPLQFTTADSGTSQFVVTYKSELEGTAVISGGRRLILAWRQNGKVFSAKVQEDIEPQQLFVNGRLMTLSRYPNAQIGQNIAFQGFANDSISAERVSNWADPSGGFFHAIHYLKWGSLHYRIDSKNKNNSLNWQGGWQVNRVPYLYDSKVTMVQNIFEQLDVEEEWFFNRSSKTLYLVPPKNTDLRSAVVQCSLLRNLILFNGTSAEPVRNITLQGFSIRHAARTFMLTKEPLLRSDWSVYRGGAILLKGSESVVLKDLSLDELGGNGVVFSGYNRYSRVQGCYFRQMGASGVLFLGEPRSVREPLFEYNQRHNYSALDRTPGPIGKEFPAECQVLDSLFKGIGRWEYQSAGVSIHMSFRIRIMDVTVRDTPRAGINIGDGNWGGHFISRLEVFNTVLLTSDHGAFNSWGRDRYWDQDQYQVSQSEFNKDKSLPFLDCIEPIVIQQSRWRCDKGWDIDLDDGSTNFVIRNNVLLSGGLKFREGFARSAVNNIIVRSGLHPHVWFYNSSDTMKSNFLSATIAPISMPQGTMRLIDWNWYQNQSGLDQSRKLGSDSSSVWGDPAFVAAEKGDFRIQNTKLMQTINFTNFGMSFGVKKSSLQREAGEPAFNQSRVSV